MKLPVVTLVKWLFLAIGIGLLAGALRAPSDAAVVLVLLGLAFAAVGGGIIGHGWWCARNEAFLRQNGQLIQADFQQVEINETLEVNGAHPFRIVAQWFDARNNEMWVFKSANLWFDPSQFVENRQIPVYIDPGKPSRYHVDLSFLPKMGGQA